MKDQIALTRTLLAVLPDTPADVASRLLDKGCFGRPGFGGNCPLTRYLQRHGVDAPVVYYTGVRLLGVSDAFVALPAAARRMTAAYDNGHFLYLDEDGAGRERPVNPPWLPYRVDAAVADSVSLVA